MFSNILRCSLVVIWVRPDKSFSGQVVIFFVLYVSDSQWFWQSCSVFAIDVLDRTQWCHEGKPRNFNVTCLIGSYCKIDQKCAVQ
jgi:hypothetical protein